MIPWRLLPFSRPAAPDNMATDEAVYLGCRDHASPPTLRFYGWQAPSLSVGYFQDIGREIDLEACRRLSVAIVRRPTGGKAVLHGGDLTYALTAADRHGLFPPDILGTYRLIGLCLARGLAELGIRADMAAAGRPLQDAPAQASCFAVPSRYELLVGGRKICGSAQVRSRGAFLQQGSLLVDFDPCRTGAILIPGGGNREEGNGPLEDSVTSLRGQLPTVPGTEELCRVMKGAFEAVLGVRIEEGRLTREEASLQAELRERKYGSEAWTMQGGAVRQASP